METNSQHFQPIREPQILGFKRTRLLFTRIVQNKKKIELNQLYKQNLGSRICWISNILAYWIRIQETKYQPKTETKTFCSLNLLIKENGSSSFGKKITKKEEEKQLENSN